MLAGRSLCVSYSTSKTNFANEHFSFTRTLQKVCPPMCDNMVWLALFTERRASGAWTSPLLGSTSSGAISDRVGNNRTKQEITSDCLMSVATIVSTAYIFKEHT